MILGPSCPKLAWGVFWKFLTKSGATMFAWHEHSETFETCKDLWTEDPAPTDIRGYMVE